jgi:hypothetical protein
MHFKHIVFTLISFLFFNSQVKAEEVSSVYGKILTSKKTIFGLSSPYFVTFEHQGKLLAYPVDTNSKTMAEKVKSFLNKDALLEGTIKKVNFKVDGRIYIVEKFIPKTIRPLELSALGQAHWSAPECPEFLPTKEKKKESFLMLMAGSNNPYDDRLPVTRGPKPGAGVGFRLNDTVANTLIFTGAAALIGSQLLKRK